jgi:hypothetical protein
VTAERVAPVLNKRPAFVTALPVCGTAVPVLPCDGTAGRGLSAQLRPQGFIPAASLRAQLSGASSYVPAVSSCVSFLTVLSWCCILVCATVRTFCRSAQPCVLRLSRFFALCCRSVFGTVTGGVLLFSAFGVVGHGWVWSGRLALPEKSARAITGE